MVRRKHLWVGAPGRPRTARRPRRGREPGLARKKLGSSEGESEQKPWTARRRGDGDEAAKPTENQ
jgi:hypothetical protein